MSRPMRIVAPIVSRKEKFNEKLTFFARFFTHFISKSFQIWDHFFPLLLLKDSENLKSLDIELWEVGAKRCLNGVNKCKKSVKKKNRRGHFTPFRHILPRIVSLLKGNQPTQKRIQQFNIIRKSWSKGCITQGIFLDVSAALDKCWHKGLLAKLKQAKVE